MKKNSKKIILYLTIVIYGFMGVLHLLKPERFLFMIPPWLPYPLALIYISGIAEILLALFLFPKATRRISAFLIVAMLVVYLLLIHIPQTIDFYKTGHPYFLLTVLRIPLQFLFIYWIFPTKKIMKKEISSDTTL